MSSQVQLQYLSILSALTNDLYLLQYMQPQPDAWNYLFFIKYGNFSLMGLCGGIVYKVEKS